MGDSAELITYGAIFMLIAVALAHQIETYKIGFIHESGLYIILGLFGGSVWLLVGWNDNTEYSFSPDVFFDVILPPIIFTAAYTLKNKQFFNNFAPIMVLAIFGALLNFLMMAMIGVGLGSFGLEESEVMLFAATMSATDGIAVVALIDAQAYPTIFGTLIGEGCINDAVAIILYTSIDSLSSTNTKFGFTLPDLGFMLLKVLEVAFFSIIIGISVGLISALYFKYIRHQASCKVEITLIFLFGYLSYSISDILSFSGIISVFFCGICMSHYTYHSLTRDTQHASKDAFESISYMGETFIYISLGFYTFSYTDSLNWNFKFLLAMLLTLIFGRIIVVVVCVFFINVFRKNDRYITIKDQMVFWWGGIVRGSICFALSLRKTTTHSPIVVTTTFAIVIFTTFSIGSLTEMFLICIGMKDPDPTVEAAHQHRKSTKEMDKGWFKKKVSYIDETYIKKVFGGRDKKVHELEDNDPKFLQKITEHYANKSKHFNKRLIQTNNDYQTFGTQYTGIHSQTGNNNNDNYSIDHTITTNHNDREQTVSTKIPKVNSIYNTNTNASVSQYNVPIIHHDNISDIQ